MAHWNHAILHVIVVIMYLQFTVVKTIQPFSLCITRQTARSRFVSLENEISLLISLCEKMNFGTELVVISTSNHLISFYVTLEMILFSVSVTSVLNWENLTEGQFVYACCLWDGWIQLNDCWQGFFERELKKSDIPVHEPTGIEESPAPRDIVDLEVRHSIGVFLWCCDDRISSTSAFYSTEHSWQLFADIYHKWCKYLLLLVTR